MSMFGGGFGGAGMGGVGPRAGRGTSAVKANEGLPFAGVPAEVAAGVHRLESLEPDHGDPGVTFSQQPSRQRLLSAHRGPIIGVVLLVIAETVFLQSGPLLVQVAIDHGIVPGNRNLLVIAALAYVFTVGAGWFTSSARIRLSGSLASSAMRDLRIRVFGHLQRLSMDYYTGEKAGVILTRMTSDVEALQQLLQEGLAQFAVQGLTMIIVTAVLFSYDMELAAITLLLVMPVLIGLSVWFRRQSDVAFGRQRDTITAMFADLSESLHGTRVVTAHNRDRKSVV